MLALLPTAADNILDALQVENITHELQQHKAERLSRSIGSADLAPSELSSSGTPSVADGDGQSLSSFQTESFMHTSQMGASGSDPGLPQPRKTKAQLWSELKTSCEAPRLLRPVHVADTVKQSRDLSPSYIPWHSSRFLPESSSISLGGAIIYRVWSLSRQDLCKILR